MLAGLATLAALLAAAPAALAAPDITLDKQAPGTVLFGDASTVTLRATNPAAQPYGYNLSFRDVLPPGVSYVPGSASVDPVVIPNAPTTGETTLIFENVSDLSPGSSYDLTYRVDHDTGVFSIGDSYTNSAGAYINSDPRFVPDFAPDGTPAGQSTGSATDTATTDISAIEIEKHEPSPEGELLRGVHDHQTVYTLTVRNNAIEPTSGVVVEDWLPARLEYLGCGTADNTTDAPTNPGSTEEYPGSGPLNPGNAPAAPLCVEPNLVETVLTDPDGAGPMATGVYTHVVWNGLTSVPANGEVEIQYVAAVPIRENTLTWTNPFPPTPASLGQASNLDNNSGPETAEEGNDEPALTNYSRVEGDYDGTLPVSDDDTLTRSAEDLRVLKSVSPETINQGQLSEWTLDIQTSEYRYAENIRVDDTLPDGLCPLGAVNYEGGGLQDAECAPTGDLPSHAYTTVDEASDGSYAIAWDESTVPELEQIGPSDTVTIAFPTKTRHHYQEGFQDAGPVLAEDAWENTVGIAGADYRVCAPADPTCTGSGTKIDGDETDGTDDFDISAARQEAGGITIDKRVREAAPTPVDCATGAYVDGPAPSYGPGDTICWLLRADFASLLDTGGPTLTDFLPPGVTYVGGSAQRTGNDTLPSTTFSDAEAANGVLTWNLGGDVPEGSKVFEWRLATTVDQTPSDEAGDLEGNLMKLSFENTAGTTFPLRDDVNFERAEAELDLVKGVRDVDDTPVGGNPADTDGETVAAGDVVTYRVDVSNTGDLDAAGAEVWDELEDGITCDDVDLPSISDGGGCTGSRIEWTGVAVAAGTTHTLTYDVTVPAGVEPGRRFDNRAGVVSYTSATNTGGSFPYRPIENIDGGPGGNAPAADDDSWVQTRTVEFEKTRETAVNEAGNNLASQATIGERIDYTATIVVPAGTTIYGSPVFTDDLGARQTYVTPPAASATLNGGALPGDFTLDTTGNVVSLQFPATYSNPDATDDTIEIQFSARPADVAANNRGAGNLLTNTATFDWEDQDTSPHEDTAQVTTTIVEPNVAVAKDEDDADDVVEPGQSVQYTVTASNTSGTRVSTAHDLELVDHVPAGLTPETPISGGSWDPGTRTITWTIASLAPGAQTQRTYTATVDDPASAGQVFDNTVDLTASSLAGAGGGERGPGSPVETGYVAEAEDSVRLGDATLTKTVDPGEATIGELATYTTQVVFPANVNYYDATVLDTLPDGLEYVETVGVTCNGGSCTPAVQELPDEPQPDGTTRLGWFLGDLASGPARTYELTYTAYVRDAFADASDVGDGDTLTNVADAFYNGVDTPGTPTSIPDPSGFTNGSNADQADVGVVEPDVTIDKGVSGDGDNDDVRPTQPGDSYTYSLTVRNDGTSPAYDIQVEDTPDAALLRNIEVIDNPDATEDDSDGSDGTLAWTIPGPLGPGEEVTLQYTADLAPSSALTNGATVVNTADVTELWGASSAERAAEPGRPWRPYTDVPSDTVTLNVHLPELTLTKDPVTSGPAQVGEPFTWRVTIANSSSYAAAESVDVTDVLPPNWTYVDDSATLTPGGAIDPTGITAGAGGDTLTWENVGDIAPGGDLVLQFQARPTVAAIGDPGTGAGSPHVNDARATAVDVSGASGSADGPYEADDDAQAVLELPQLTVAKTPDGDVVHAGDPATYSIEIANDGDVPARDVEVEDVLGPGQAYTPWSATAAPATGFAETSVTTLAGETTIAWTIAEIPAHGSVTITLPVATDSSLADATNLVNDVSVTSREISTPVTDDGSLVTDVDSDVGIVKQAQAGAVAAGEVMDFTLTVTNHGPSDASGVTVEDVLPANLSFVDADDPCGESAGTVTCAIGDLAAGQSVELTLQVRVDPDETVSVSNTATVDSTTPDSNSANDESTAGKTVGVEANVRVEKDGPAAPVLQGSSFEYAIAVRNDGVSAATGVTLSDPLPAGVSFEQVTTDRGTCSEAAGTVSCALGTLEPGEAAEVVVRVHADDPGLTTNVATATTPSTETTTDDNDDDAEVEILPSADLGVTKTAPPAADPGSEIEYELGVTNNGPSAASGVTLTDTLPPGVQFVSADPDCSHLAGVVTCTVGALAVSETRQYAVTVSVPYALGGRTLTNSVAVNGNEGDLVAANDTAHAETTIGPVADLSIGKVAGGATAGSTASWTIVVENHGPSTANPVTVADSLPAGTTLRSAAPSQGSCAANGADVTCDLGALGAGAAAQISVVADVAAGTVGQELRNRASVSAPQPDPNPSNNAAEAVTGVRAAAAGGPNVVFTKVAGKRRPRLGQPFVYKLDAHNVGDAAARRVTVVDTLSDAVRFQRVTTDKGRCSRDGARVSCAIRTLAAGEKATVRLVVVPVAPGRLRNTASATVGGTADVQAANNSDVANVRVMAAQAGWTLSKRAGRSSLRGGETVRFAITVRTRGRAVAGVRVCDRLPAGLVFVKARGARFRNGRACWSLRYLRARARRTFHVTARAERGFSVRRVRNVAVATARNASRRRAAARVRIYPAFGGAGGGVTG